MPSAPVIRVSPIPHERVRRTSEWISEMSLGPEASCLGRHRSLRSSITSCRQVSFVAGTDAGGRTWIMKRIRDDILGLSTIMTMRLK